MDPVSIVLIVVGVVVVVLASAGVTAGVVLYQKFFKLKQNQKQYKEKAEKANEEMEILHRKVKELKSVCSLLKDNAAVLCSSLREHEEAAQGQIDRANQLVAHAEALEKCVSSQKEQIGGLVLSKESLEKKVNALERDVSLLGNQISEFAEYHEAIERKAQQLQLVDTNVPHAPRAVREVEKACPAKLFPSQKQPIASGQPMRASLK
ncbi:MAG TPA: hypothetical protein VNC84_03305 [Gammaproteobacteria bacterium]|jgi:chromosome segregation ATPase|nr:hypothetical protein [Gammaproteobacteria bacterium]